jgi:methylmalonyl-CoA/ethylmalonyl-CoA epimerase
MLKGIHHVAVAVESIEKTLPVYRDLLGFELHEIEEVPSEKVRVAVMIKGNDRVELVEPADADSPITGFLKKRGPGLHHVCLDVEGLAGMLDSLKAAGVPLIHEEPKPGAEGRQIAFVHPKGTGGVLIELSEAGEEA